MYFNCLMIRATEGSNMFLLIFLLSVYVTGSVRSSVIVTSTGPVLGKVVESDEGVPYYAYLGIPYGESPEGSLRFKPSLPKRPWKKIFNATQKGPVCPQPEGTFTKDEMSEDCLTINICVPPTNEKILRPAYFYIHGGSFKSNTGNIDEYGPEFYIKQGIIYVSVNYRLGALGYLSLGTEAAPGNAGIKDIILALKWVKENIRKFGGGAVTIGGQSSGAALVHYLLLTEKTTGLFQRAILQSGSALNFRFFSEYPKVHAFSLANELGFPTDDVEALIKNLTNADAFEIVKAQENVYKTNRNIMRPFAPFVPSIEKESSHAVLTKSPKEIIHAGIPQNVPVLAGINSREGIYMWPSLIKKPEQTLKDNFTLCIPYNIEYPLNSSEYKQLVKSISDLYFGGPDLSNWTLINFFDLVSDTQYTLTIDLWLRKHTQKLLSKPVYYYEFDFEGDLNYAKIRDKITFPGTAHADDLGYVFVTKTTRPLLKNIDTQTQKTLKNIVTYFSNFIKVGNPTPLPYGGDVIWPMASIRRHYLLLNDNPKTKFRPPFKVRFDFWNKIYTDYNNYLKKGGSREPRIPPNFTV